MKEGRRTAPAPALAQIRDRCRRELDALPAPLRELRDGEGTGPVRISGALRALAQQLDAQIN